VKDVALAIGMRYKLLTLNGLEFERDTLMRTWITRLALSGFALTALSAPTLAAPFGISTAAFNFNGPVSGEPQFAFGGTTGTLALGDGTTVASATGTLASTTGGTSTGTLTYSMTVGTTLSQTQAGAFTLTDGTTTYTFDLQSVETVQAADNGNGTSSISLYLLGQISATGLDPATTSVSLNYTGNNTTGKEVNDNLALSDPPTTDPNAPGGGSSTPMPEPVSLALLAGGLASTAILRRRRRS
jgi:hypothetical protein